MNKCCPKSGKISYKSRREAYEYNKNRRLKVKVYECKCGDYHVTKHRHK